MIELRDIVGGEGFSCPRKGGVGYQIFVESFRDGDGDGKGDLKGILEALPYLDALGVGRVWLTPIFKSGSYHRYDTEDYLKVDPPLGTEDDLKELIEAYHSKGIEVILDLVLNHTSFQHPWFLQSQKDVGRGYYGPGSKADYYCYIDGLRHAYTYSPVAKKAYEGRFSGWMPDLNLDSPDVRQEVDGICRKWLTLGVDGFRLDAVRFYYFQEREKTVEFLRFLRRTCDKYRPGAYIVGEAWMNYTIGSAYWQKGSRLNFDGEDSGLKTVMDFRLMGIASQAFHQKKGGLQAIFEHMCYDFVYPDIYHVLRFLENHDTDRFLPALPESVEDLYAFKQGMTFLLTIPGIPQLYYGQELLMNGNKSKSDGYVRLDVPGGWPGDTRNEFTAEGRSAVQNEAWNFLRTILHWRKDNDVIAHGQMKHFMPDNGVYVYERRLGERSAIVIMNGQDEPVNLSLDRYAEILRGKTSGKDILTNRTIPLQKELSLSSKEILILEM